MLRLLVCTKLENTRGVKVVRVYVIGLLLLLLLPRMMALILRTMPVLLSLSHTHHLHACIVEEIGGSNGSRIITGKEGIEAFRWGIHIRGIVGLGMVGKGCGVR